jgi:hypothetical protein
MKRKTFLLTLACLWGSLLCAQAVHVHYDIFRDSVYYLKNGKSLRAPQVRKGDEIVVHVENYNNYLYSVALEVEEEEIPVANNNPSLLMSNLGGGANPLNMLFKGGDQMMGAFKFFPSLSGNDLAEGSGFITSEAEKIRQEKVGQLRKLEADFTRSKDQLFALDSEMKTLQEKIMQQVAAQRLQAFAVQEINHIRYNPHLEPAQIKRLTGEYMEKIFLEKDPNKIDLNQVLKIADAQTELPKAIEEYRMKCERYASGAANCERLMREFKKFDFPESNLGAFQSSAEAFVGAAQSRTSALEENAEMLASKIPEIRTLDPQILSELRTAYLELNTNSFSKTYRQNATGEVMKFKVVLTPIDSMQRHGLKSVETAPVSVQVSGGLRVRASVGLNFGQFFNRPQSYFIRDSVLRSSDKDAFVPFVTSFVHFYSPGARAVSVAGSFGVGFPLGGGESLQSVSFFLGPSLMFGKSERIVLNLGIMGGKTERLSQGYQVGDTYFSDANEAPVGSVYELGYYVGVSFNLSGN